jgi:lipopolysaccharide transport system ATP-binding protein
MSDVILKVENVSKLYRLGTVGTGTFGGDVQRFWKTKILGQEDPFLKVGQINDRTSKEKTEFVWALKDINFEVKRGEVLGIIGKNGAGKSTLLKLLSRITSPTTGSIKSAGRMASLLEVGTGFHPELTGRENIFLNGAILGMTKKEIQSKFDEIVDFSGCELYIDTPTKRYSSGMTVRLGFAVAAFLDPEILVVDEVLAVGDAEFQKKAIGKMQDVSRGEGKTVLFVSHNMESISQLCASSILLENGNIKNIDLTHKIITQYFEAKVSQKHFNKINFLLKNTLFSNFYINNCISDILLFQGETIEIKFDVEDFSYKNSDLKFNFEILKESGVPICSYGNYFQINKKLTPDISNFTVKIDLGDCTFGVGRYLINIYFEITKEGKKEYVYLPEHLIFEVVSSRVKNNRWGSYVVMPQHGFLSLPIYNISYNKIRTHEHN